MTYFFSGIKHSGKSTHARLFAEFKDLPFFDLDSLIVDNIKYDNVRELYENEGKEAFMEMEYICLKKLLDTTPESKVIALGGGICDNERAFELCTNLIYLDLDEKVLLNRIKYNGLPPFLRDQPAKQFHILYEKREKLYKEKASLVIEIKDASVYRVFEKIRNTIIEWEK
jgi:shikimate kinase